MVENVEFESRYKLELEARDLEISDFKVKLEDVSLDSKTQTMTRADIVAQELVKPHVKIKNGHFEISVSLKLDFKLPNNFGLAPDRVAATKKKALTRGGVEDTRLEAKAKDTKKNPRPRPKTAFPRTDTLEAKAKDQGYKRKCSPKKKRSSQKFSSDLDEKTFSKKFFKRSTKF